MRQLRENGIYVFYQTENAQLLLGDTFELLQKLRPESVDVIFADPPYFLSNNGITCRSGKMVSVNKAAWDMVDDKEHMLANKHQFNRHWISLCKRVLKPNGTIWISGTFHNIFSIGMALEEEGFRIINNITWQKTNPPPNLACRCFTHSTETIIWACKDDKKTKYLVRADQSHTDPDNPPTIFDILLAAVFSPSVQIYNVHKMPASQIFLSEIQ